ncbi:MAG: IMPACT family protein [Fidelibacterota bacterium]
MTHLKYILTESATGEFRDRGSKFLGFAFHFESIDELKSLLKQLKTEHSGSTHICYAYRLMDNRGVIEYSTDAGEPSGSSGVPILNMIRRHHLVDTVIFVARYFGGTKLGIPGLINAYGSCAEECIRNSKFEKWTKMITIRFNYAYDLQRIVDPLLNQFKCKIIQQEFSETISIEIKIQEKNEEYFSDLLFNHSNGMIKTEAIKKG